MNQPDGEALNQALGDLRAFIRQAQAHGELVIVRAADPHLEIGAHLSSSARSRPIRRRCCSRA